MMPVVAIRADASSQIGTGHVMRCLTLGGILQKHGFEVFFMTKKLPGNLDHKIREHHFSCITLSSESEADEVAEVCWILKNKKVILTIFDHYGLTVTYEKSIKEQAGVTLLTFDDTYEKHHCDLLLNQNLYADAAEYLSLVPETCTVLCGLQYALIREEFKLRSPRKRLFPVENGHQHILITLGGADPDNVTLTIMRVLEGMRRDNWTVDVVIGAANPHVDEIKAYAHSARCHFAIIVDASNMSELMNRADFAISAGGSTTIELLYLSVPTLILVLAENQSRIASYMHEHAIGYSLGMVKDLSYREIQETLSKITADPKIFTDIIENMQKYRISDNEALLKEICCTLFSSFTLRLAADEDIMNVFHLSNQPDVRRNSLSSKQITLNEHKQWFAKRVKERRSPFMIVEKNGIFLGQLRLEKQEEGYIISISLIELARGCNIASRIIDKAVPLLPPKSTIIAYIKENNLPSLKMFQKNGFVVVDNPACNEKNPLKLVRSLNDDY